MSEPVVLSVVVRLLLPAILLFGLYVQGHGEISPGGGFQAGVIVATGIVAFALVHGIRRARRALPAVFVESAMAVGLTMYVGVGFATLLLGGQFLDYAALAAQPALGRHIGIFLIELGVGLAVASVMVTIFFTFAAVGRDVADSTETDSDDAEGGGR